MTRDRVIYYRDERSDDFAAVTGTSVLPDGYEYERGTLFRALSFLLYRVLATPDAARHSRVFHGLRVYGKEKLKESRGRGIFVYANHTLDVGDAFFPSVAMFPRRTFVITGAGSVTFPVAGRLAPYLGALPLPSSRAGYRDFLAAVKKRLDERVCVYVYPEAHIWPYYTGVREFSDASFLYPAKFGAPVYAATTVFRKRRLFAAPRCEVYIDGPFLPDESSTVAENKSRLHAKARAAMLSRSLLSDCEYVRYVRMT